MSCSESTTCAQQHCTVHKYACPPCSHVPKTLAATTLLIPSHAFAAKVLGGICCHLTHSRTLCTHLVPHIPCGLAPRVYTIPHTPGRPTDCAGSHTRGLYAAGFAECPTVWLVGYTDTLFPVAARGICGAGGVAKVLVSTQARHLGDGIWQGWVDTGVIEAGTAGLTGACAARQVHLAAFACRGVAREHNHGMTRSEWPWAVLDRGTQSLLQIVCLLPVC